MSHTWLYGNKAKRKIIILHIVLKPETTVHSGPLLTVPSWLLRVQFCRERAVVWEQPPLIGFINFTCEHSSNAQLSFLRIFPISDTKTSLPHIARPWIRAHYTKLLFFQSDFRYLFSCLVQQVRRFCHKTPVVSIAYCILVFFFPLRVAITVIIASSIMRHAYMCAFFISTASWPRLKVLIHCLFQSYD